MKFKNRTDVVNALDNFRWTKKERLYYARDAFIAYTREHDDCVLLSYGTPAAYYNRDTGKIYTCENYSKTTTQQVNRFSKWMNEMYGFKPEIVYLYRKSHESLKSFNERSADDFANCFPLWD